MYADLISVIMRTWTYEAITGDWRCNYAAGYVYKGVWSVYI